MTNKFKKGKMNQRDFKIGEKVTYTPKGEKGIVLGFPPSLNYLFVVYDNWEYYRDYTAISTNVMHLKKGWKDETI